MQGLVDHLKQQRPWKWGRAAVLVNTAVATANDTVAMAGAFELAVRAGRQAHLAGIGRVIDRNASASSPLTGFLHA